MKDEDVSHLQWIYDRMRFHHGESHNVDYMIKFKSIIKGLMIKNKTKIIIHKEDLFGTGDFTDIPITDCCKRGPICDDDKYCAFCGKKIIR